ncbi:SdrD B-like domain-containing protein, partial [Staphylococcus schleiferi]
MDSGFYKPTYSLGDKVWEDTNKNGIQDDGEKG